MDELYFYDCNLNIKSFAGMLENPTQCYKFFLARFHNAVGGKRRK